MARQKAIIMPSASFIVARSSPGNVIGCENKLPWKLSTDLKRFRQLTQNHVVLMGRKTLESIGRPLPNRINIVMSRSSQTQIEGVLWAKSPIDAIFIADYLTIMKGLDEFFVIGGAEIFDRFKGKDFYNTVYLTEVFCDVPGDTFFTNNFDGRVWKVTDEKDFPAGAGDEYPFKFITYQKRARTVRERLRSEFLTDHKKSADWLKDLDEASKKSGHTDRTTAQQLKLQQIDA